jgi:Xaa-Pro aminopeptidase
MTRLEQVISKIKKEGLNCFVFEQMQDLFYLSGYHVEGIFVVHPKKSTLFLDDRYFPAVEKEKRFLVKNLTQFSFSYFGKNNKIGFDGHVTSVDRLAKLKKQAKGFGLLKNKSRFLGSIRQIKQADELQKIKKACAINMKVFEHLLKEIKEGITESELALKLKTLFLKEGVVPSFEPIIAFGKNSAIPHHHPNQTRLKKGDIILIDMGCVFENYCSDMTRIAFFKNINPKLQNLFDLVFAAKAVGFKLIRANLAQKILDKAVRDVFKKAKVEHLFTHSLSHGIGLQVHEEPFIRKNMKTNEPLKENMVITIEPGLYVTGVGGVRLEDQIVVKKEGFENLTPMQKNIILIP